MEGKTIIKNTVFQSASRFITSGITFIITIIIASYLGVSLYGDYTTIVSFVGLFYLVADFGLNAVFIRDQKMSFAGLLYLRILISLSLIIIANLIAFALPISQTGFSETIKIGISIFSLTILSQAIVFSSSAIFQKKLEYQHLMIANIIGSLVTFFSVGIVILFNLSFIYIILSFVIGAFFAASLTIKLTNEKVMPFSLPREKAKELIVQSAPLGIMLIANLIYFRIDILLLNSLTSSQDVGIYGFAYRFFDFLIALPLFLSNALYPYMIKDTSNTKTKKFLIYAILTSIIVTIICLIIAPIIGIISHSFSDSQVPLRILVLSLPIFTATSILQWKLIANKKQIYLMWLYMLGAVINVLLNIIFIPSFGYIASAVITIVTESIILIGLIYKLNKNAKQI